MSKDDWVDKPAKKTRVALEISAHVWARIPKHKRQLINTLKKELRKLYLANGNIKVTDVKVIWEEGKY